MRRASARRMSFAGQVHGSEDEKASGSRGKPGSIWPVRSWPEAALAHARADNQVAPADEQARGELLRLMASDAMRGAIERHYGVRLAFQNCHRAAVFRPAALTAPAEFTSPQAQLLNQKPELVNC
jgi:hypothetical protein